MPRILPCLWFDDSIAEAVEFYCDVFKDAEIRNMQRMPDGKVFTATFRLRDQEFMALNGGPLFPFTEAVSFFVSCADQAEVDYFWEKFTTNGGTESRCGWLKDRFGLSWQIVPQALPNLIGGPDRVAAGRAMQAMLKMRKIDVAALEAAYAGP
jgi:predicted 3-demethylubiquinone-9 3-methyltransferase (glyoxalase superfamily)